ncbi:MAG TPA: response regulator [Terriglobales bacterium]|jgi:CheY-like chemotaxis protein|nr:response regulator [Terriglobales bacterium]
MNREVKKPLRPRVLEVSGQEIVRVAIKHACEKLGFDVFVASNGDEALAIYHSDGPFEFILSDADWLGHDTDIKDAFHLAREIRREFPDQKIGLHSSRDEIINNSADLPVLVKPFLRAQQVDDFLRSFE